MGRQTLAGDYIYFVDDDMLPKQKGKLGELTMAYKEVKAMKLLCVSTGDAARMLEVSRSTIWRHVQEGLLQRIHSGNFSLIPFHEVAERMGITFSEALGIAEGHRIDTHTVFIERVTGVDR